MRSVFVQWPLLVRRGDRLLAELRDHTPIDTLELSDFTLDWEHSESARGASAPGALALPPTDHFDGLPFPVPIAEPREYDRLASALAAASAAGFKVACNVTPLYAAAPEASRFGCLDANRKPVPCIRPNLETYGCPSHPEIVAYAAVMTRAFIAEWPALDVLTINHAEYPLWPQQRPDELLVCFCDACRGRADEQGLDLEHVRAELNALARRVRQLCAERATDRANALSELFATSMQKPEVAAWLELRRDAVSACVQRVTAVAREEAAAAGKSVSIGLEFQLPALAPLVGTDLARIAGGLDFLVAKFPDYLAAAVLPGLVEGLAGEEDPHLIAGLRALLGVGRGPRQYAPAVDPKEGIRYANAFDPGVFDLQLPRLGAVWGSKPIYAYLWKYGGDSAELRAKIEAVEERGFDGYFLWVWNQDLDEGAPQVWSLPRSNREGVL